MAEQPMTLAGVAAVADDLIDPSFFHDEGHIDAETVTAIARSLRPEGIHDDSVGAQDTLNDHALAAHALHSETLDNVDLAAGLAPPPPHQHGVSPPAELATPVPIYQAPFSRPDRDETTPHPQVMTFATRPEFELWFEGESSWCHYVQRRFTTPEKRAEERLRARIKAHEQKIADEQASAQPLKRRKRKRTSKVIAKITYTCHHAGKYTSRHSTTLPRDKLRLNTKKSVKCNCAARIVLSEMDDGECRVTYWWKHEGHDAYAKDELENGRLPKIIDDWLVRQIEAGKDLDQIRRSLDLTEEEKTAYLQKVSDDPSTVDPDMPPALALHTRIKYPDIYNRYRKLRGPIKGSRSGSRQRTGSARDSPAVKNDVDDQPSSGLTSMLARELVDQPPAGFDGAGAVGEDVEIKYDADMQPFDLSEQELERLTAGGEIFAQLAESSAQSMARTLLEAGSAGDLATLNAMGRG